MMTIKGKEILDCLEMTEFVPHPWFRSGLSQTVVASLYSSINSSLYSLPSEKIHLVDINEMEKLALVEYDSKTHEQVVLFVHGLNGSHHSTYIQRLAKIFHDKGFSVFCLNLRNAGIGLGKAQSTYHAGRSEDVCSSVKYINKLKSPKQIFLVGFSLGANIVLKAMGEGQLNFLDIKAVAISPPVDLDSSSKNRIQKGSGKFFDYLFSYSTYREFKKMLPFLKIEKKLNNWNWRMKLSDLDDQFTAPLNGFRSGKEYYEMASAARVLNKIIKPTLVLTAMDDPVICPEFLQNYSANNVDIVITDKGGHVGYLSSNKKNPYWMDELIVRFIQK